MTVMETSTQLWFFESHNNAKRSQWLQSTLSELEDKTKGMLKLIEGDADTFAQRAEMYYKKRPELVNMIEDFYRSYRSLAESHDQLRLESGNSILNRRFSLTSRSSTNESLASSIVTSNSDSDSDSEVDDPVQEVESKLKETQVECMVEIPTDKNSEVCIEKPMVEETEEIRSKEDIFTEDHAKAASNLQSNDKEQMPVYLGRGETHGDGKFKETQVNCMLEKSNENNSKVCAVKPMVQEIKNKEDIFTEDHAKAASNLQSNDKKQMPVYLGRGETHGEGKFKETQVNCMLEKSNENISEVCAVKLMVQEIKSKNILIEDLAKAASKMQFDDKKDVPAAHGKRETHGDIELAKLTHSEYDFKLSGVTFPKYELEEYPDTKSENCEIKPMIETKPLIKSSEATQNQNYVEGEVQRLKGEIASYKVELEQKDEEKREVIRQLSASMDMLKGENDRMKNFIIELRKQGRVFELRKLKDVFCKNPFGKHFRFPTPLLAV